MARPRVPAAGGLASVMYTLRKGREAGGVLKLYGRMRARNACKTCAVGMGGQHGGMTNEVGSFPEVCKKSVQAQAGDMGRVVEERYLREHTIEQMMSLRPVEFEPLGRLAFPIVAGPGDTHFRRISWDRALDLIGDAFREAAPDETFFYASGRSSNEAAYLLQLVARAFGTNNVHNCSYYCHAASGVALGMVYGSGTASITLDDLDHADLALIAGANPASNHPRLITKLVALRRRGGKVIIVNPLKELGLERFRVPSDWRSMIFGSQVSDLYLQPHIGSDVALFKALLKAVVEAGAVDHDFVSQYSSGWGELRADVGSTSWETLTAACGLPREQIQRAAEMIVAAKRGIFMWAMGLTHHEHGVDNILALSNLALSRGWLGARGCGLLPIRGHSNVQGVGSCGVSPGVKKAFAERMQSLYGFEIPKQQGQDTYSSMGAAEEGRIRAAFLLGGNLFASNPDRAWATRAMGNIPLVAYVSTKLNEGHVHARGKTTLILPPLARDEEGQSTTQESMFNYVRLSEGGEPAVPGEMRSEVEIIAALAERILPEAEGGSIDWAAMRSHETLREQMAQVVPGYAAIGEIGKTGREFQIEGRTFHEPSFATEDGKAAFHVTPLPSLPPLPADDEAKGLYRLMTIRSEGQFNTVVYEDEDLYRGNTRRDIVMMSPEDAGRLRVNEGDRVIVETEAGSMLASAAITDIRAGNLAMYYPEANALVPRRIDARSKTPAFKSVFARVKVPRSSGSA